MVISSTPAWCDCVLTYIRSIYRIQYGTETRRRGTERFPYGFIPIRYIEFVFDTNFDIFEYRTGTAFSKVAVADRELI